MQKQKSKSQILETLFEEVDEQLESIPTLDHDGGLIEDSMHMDMYTDAIANIHFTDSLNRKHYPFNKTIATILVEDELECRKLEPTKEDEYGNNV
tara:strand:+ start:461 stop:745 length:285 start_codon:yes stop_codon:yes gene_type:complete